MSDKAAAPQSPLQPPEEQFWQRYSPHGEAPLSFAGSFTLHLLVGGVLFLVIVASASALAKTSRSLPVEPVRLKIGGGGGHVKGKGGGPGIGNPNASGDEAGEDDLTLTGISDTAPKLPQLQPTDRVQIQEKFAPEDARYIEKSNNETARALAKLNDNLRKQIAPGDGRPGKGGGGPGEGGGKDKGKDKGKGSSEGDGKASLTQREKRMLRWHMRFTASTGPDYVAQLSDLGAILAFPVKEGPNPEYKLVRDLKQRPAQLLDEDLSKIQRIYWIDDKPKSVQDVVGALGLNIRPSRFVAFMPEELENELFRMERSYVEKVLRRKFDEDKIEETHFKVERKGGRFQPELLSVTMRP